MTDLSQGAAAHAVAAHPAHAAAVHPAFAVGLAGFDWIEANAGSGKTWTITALVARAVVEREADPRGIAVVTFTRAAAAELRARIRRRLVDLRDALDAALAGPAALVAIDDAFARPYAESIAAGGRERLDRARRRVLAALASADEMTVSTIHGFAQRLLAEFGPSFGAPDDARFGADLTDLVERLQAEFWRTLTADASGALVEAIGAGCDIVRAAQRRLESALKQPAARIQAQPGDAARAAERWREAWQAIRRLWPERGAALVAAIDAHPQVDRRKWRKDWTPGRTRPLDVLCASPSPWRTDFAKTRSELVESLSYFTSAGMARWLKTGPALSDPALNETVAAVDALHAAARAFWDEAPDMLACAWRDAALAGLDQAKRRAQRFDHDDALRLLAQGLDAARHTDLAARIAARHPFLFLDEAQDTDPLQWSVIERIWLATPTDARRGGLVAVGDPKQAIYAFRDADVYAYLAAKQRCRPAVYTLADNRRSVAALVQGVNALCSREGAFVEPRIGYVGSVAPADHDAGTLVDPAEAHAAGADAPLRIACFAEAGREARIRWVAGEVARLLDARRGARIRHPDGHDTAVEPRDIGVLVRTGAEGAMMRDALRALGIGSVEVSNASVLDTDDARDLEDVIAALAWPDEPMRVRGALATPLLSADAGAVIEALEGDGAARRAVEFRALRRAWLASGPLVALRRIFERAGTGALLAALPDGERRLANLLHLADLLQAAMPATRTPQAALAWLGSAARREADDAQLRLDDDASLVRISTIHKSKGLEYPVVFVPFAPEMTHEPPRGGTRHDYPVWHDEDGGLRAVLDLRTARPAAVEARIRQERAAEQVRLAYVAVTRARLRCTVCWTIDKSARRSPFAWLLHGIDPAAGDAAFDAKAAQQALAALQAAHPGCIAVVQAQAATTSAVLQDAHAPLPDGPAPPFACPASDAPRLAARPFDHAIARPLDRLNFTMLLTGSDPGDEGAFESGRQAGDDRADTIGDDLPGFGDDLPGLPDVSFASGGDRDDDAPAGREAADAVDVRWRFPVGRRAGACLHEILETADWRAGVRAADCDTALRRWGLVEQSGDAPALAAWLDEALAAPVPVEAPFALRDASTRLLREFEFQLPLRAQARALEAALRPLGPVRALGDRLLLGTLRGFIDAVFEHDGRLWVLDWKSTYLGARADDYDAPVLARAMRDGGYRLQAALYSAAVVRWMRTRRPDWDPGAGFGGAIHVFLRGAGAAPGAGFHVERYDARDLERLADVFCGDPPQATPFSPDPGAAASGSFR